MLQWLLAPLGLALVALAAVDLMWTTLAVGSGAGPVTDRLSNRAWRLALSRHDPRTRRSHRRLAFLGILITLAAVGAWIAIALAGWTLVFSSAEGAVRSATTGAPADLFGRIYFAGYSLFTLGNGDLRPGEGWWRILTVVTTANGLLLVTLAITYLVPLASAVTARRALAGYVHALGPTGEDLVLRAWDGTGFAALSQHLVALTPMVVEAGQRHLTYPVLHYFHATHERTAAAPNLVALDDALLLLTEGVAPAHRPPPAAVAPLSSAVGDFLTTLRGAFLVGEDEAAPPPRLHRLREAGIPTVDDATFDAALAAGERRRSLLRGLLAQDGWGAPSR